MDGPEKSRFSQGNGAGRSIIQKGRVVPNPAFSPPQIKYEVYFESLLESRSLYLSFTRCVEWLLWSDPPQRKGFKSGPPDSH